jgi:hypothetical protein
MSQDVVGRCARQQCVFVESQPFSSTTLSIRSRTGVQPAFSWSFGQPQSPRNLLGTIKSLDVMGPVTLNCTDNANIIANGEHLHCEWGLVSRDGWAVVDDVSNFGFDNNDWWQSPNIDAVDQYFFGYGYNYKQAISDYATVGGVIALVPRYAHGVWWTRWFDFDNKQVTCRLWRC